MHDELPAPTTADGPTADPPDAPSRGRGDRTGDSPADDQPPARSRDGVDPPNGDSTTPPDDALDRDEDRAGDCDDRDEDCTGDCDEDPLAYRLERLRLWRTLATLAVVVARLIRSL